MRNRSTSWTSSSTSGGFKGKIPRGKIVEAARGDLPEAAFGQKGHLTEAALEHLRTFLSEVPPDRFRAPMRVADIPRLFTPETFCKVVVHAVRAMLGGASQG